MIQKLLANIMKACVTIFHMIVGDEWDVCDI